MGSGHRCTGGWRGQVMGNGRNTGGYCRAGERVMIWNNRRADAWQRKMLDYSNGSHPSCSLSFFPSLSLSSHFFWGFCVNSLLSGSKKDFPPLQMNKHIQNQKFHTSFSLHSALCCLSSRESDDKIGIWIRQKLQIIPGISFNCAHSFLLPLLSTHLFLSSVIGERVFM